MITPAEQQSLCGHYDLGQPQRCEPAGGTRNANCILHTTRGAWFIRRRHRAYNDPARIAFDHRAIEFLYARDVAVAPPRRTPGGETFWTHDGGVWEVFPALTGRHPRDGDDGDVRLLARALTQFHRAGQTFAERFEKIGPRGETDPAHLETVARKICDDTPNCALAVERYQRWIAAAARDLDDAAYAARPHTLVHGDVQPANLLIDGERVAFVDFDWCAWRPRVYDLAFAILLCCATHSSPIRGEDIWSVSQPAYVQPELTQSFLQACSGAGWPLSESESAALRPQILLSWCSCRLAGAMKVEPARRVEFLSRPPHDADELIPAAALAPVAPVMPTASSSRA